MWWVVDKRFRCIEYNQIILNISFSIFHFIIYDPFIIDIIIPLILIVLFNSLFFKLDLIDAITCFLNWYFCFCRGKLNNIADCSHLFKCFKFVWDIIISQFFCQSSECCPKSWKSWYNQEVERYRKLYVECFYFLNLKITCMFQDLNLFLVHSIQDTCSL